MLYLKLQHHVTEKINTKDGLGENLWAWCCVGFADGGDCSQEKAGRIRGATAFC